MGIYPQEIWLKYFETWEYFSKHFKLLAPLCGGDKYELSWSVLQQFCLMPVFLKGAAFAGGCVESEPDKNLLEGLS